MPYFGMSSINAGLPRPPPRPPQPPRRPPSPPRPPAPTQQVTNLELFNAVNGLRTSAGLQPVAYSNSLQVSPRSVEFSMHLPKSTELFFVDLQAVANAHVADLVSNYFTAGPGWAGCDPHS